MMRSTSLMVAALTAWSFGSSSTAHATPIYWSLFNVEGESSIAADYVTYATLNDMLTDSNRTGVFNPNTVGNSSRNVVGSGAFVTPAMLPVPVPEPATLGLFGVGLACLGLIAARRATR